MEQELTVEEKYRLYEESVQCPEYDVEFIVKEYKKIYDKEPTLLREDFCGTGAFSCEWVKASPKNEVNGIDLDSAPIDYGRKTHFKALTPDQQDRVEYHQMDVLQAQEIKSQVIVAFNFSYCLFKTRTKLKEYFASVRKSLGDDGFFILDIFGGLESQQLIEDEVEYDDFIYYWDCDKFNPINNEATYKIHFKKKGQKKKHMNVFIYDWRLWTIRELREILEEAGFSKTVVYWEEDDEEDEDGGGNGEYYRSEEEDNCESWVSNIVALP